MQLIISRNITGYSRAVLVQLATRFISNIATESRQQKLLKKWLELVILSLASFLYSNYICMTTATDVYYVTPAADDQFDINNDCPINHECHTFNFVSYFSFIQNTTYLLDTS